MNERCEFPRLDWPESEHGSEPCPNPGTVRAGFVDDDGNLVRLGWICEAHRLAADADVIAMDAAGDLPDIAIKPRAWRGDQPPPPEPEEREEG